MLNREDGSDTGIRTRQESDSGAGPQFEIRWGRMKEESHEYGVLQGIFD